MRVSTILRSQNSASLLSRITQTRQSLYENKMYIKIKVTSRHYLQSVQIASYLIIPVFNSISRSVIPIFYRIKLWASRRVMAFQSTFFQRLVRRLLIIITLPVTRYQLINRWCLIQFLYRRRVPSPISKRVISRKVF